MARASDTLFTFLNFISLLVGLVAISVPLSFYVQVGTACPGNLMKPILMFGILYSLVSLLGFIGSSCKFNIVMWIYLFLMVLLIVGLMAFSIFALYVTNEEAGKMVTTKRIESSGDARHWLQKHFIYGKNWYQIRSCLLDAMQVCKIPANIVDQQPDDYEYFFNIQSGCCKPPSYCGLEYKNTTYWTMPQSGPAEADNDCTTWSTHQETLCFDCNSCKRGVLANIRKEWNSFAILNIWIIIFNIIILFTGCYQLQLKYSRYASGP